MSRSRALLCTGLIASAACSQGTTAPPPVRAEGNVYTLDFGEVALGSVRTLRLTVDNPGGREGVVSVEGLDRPFEGPGRAVPVLRGRTSVEVPFVFRPRSIDPLVMKVSLTTPAGTHKLLLAGSGTAKAIDCTPSVLDLGLVLATETATGMITCTSHLDERMALRLGPFVDPTGRVGRLFSLPGGDIVGLDPHSTQEIPVLLEASVLGDLEVGLPIVDPAGARHDVAVRARVVGSLIAVEPEVIDFGDVEPGQEPEITVTLTNLSREVVRLSPAGRVEAPPFELRVPPEIPVDDPSTPAAENVVELPVTFRPQSYGPASHTFVLKPEGDGRLRHVLDIPVRGVGGGPQLACDPAVDFGTVALSLSFPRTLHCWNAGRPDKPLVLGDVTSTSPEFTLDTTRSPNPRAAPGGGFLIDILFAPQQAGLRTGTVEVQSINGGTLEIPVTGEAVRYDGCAFAVLPVRGLEFGTVEPGRSIGLELTVANRGTGPCLLRNLGLGPGSAPVFSVDPVDTVELEPGGQLVVPVTAQATEELGPVSGAVEFWISRLGASRQHVPLTAQITSGCLRFEPALADLGRVPVGCRGLPGTVTVRNTCRAPVALESLGLATSFSTSFELVDPPSMPREIPASGSLPLKVAYRPAQARLEMGGVLLRTAEGVEFIATVQGTGLAEGEPLESFRNARAVDVLVVADDSAEMDDLRAQAGELGEALALALADRRTDFHLGVTGTSRERCLDPEVPVPDGRLLPLDGQRIVRRGTPEFASTFAASVQVPTCSDESAGLAAAVTALTAPLAAVADDPRHPEPEDGNLGLLRTSTELAVLFVTATDDRSPDDASSYADALLALARPRITAHAVGPTVDGCRASSGRYEEVVHTTGGSHLSICDDWSSADAAASLAAAIAPDRLRYVLSETPPDMNGDGRITENAGEISVMVDGELTPGVDPSGTRWTFAAGVLEFAAERPPPPGASVGVRYGLVCR